MSTLTPLNAAPPGAELLRRLRVSEGKSVTSNYSHLILISVSVLPLGNATEKFWEDFEQAIADLKGRFYGEAFEISRADRGLLMKMTEYSEVGTISDIKVAVLRLIQSHFPEQFGLLDQSRLIRKIDLRLKLENTISYLERLEQRPGKTGQKAEIKLRPLEQEDIEKVATISSELEKNEFSRMFIKHQKMAIFDDGDAPVDVMDEYFIAMDALKEHVFKQVELRGSGNLFNQLTLTLDQALLSAFDDLNPTRSKCSINLNVESVFTDAFKVFLGGDDDGVFENITFEFRQANILQNYDEFMVASELILSRGGTICVDAIFPESVGVVSLKRLNARMGKIFWRQGAEAVLPLYEDDIKYLLSQGIELVLARLDDEQGLKMGRDMGIRMFQGFLIDDMIGY